MMTLKSLTLALLAPMFISAVQAADAPQTKLTARERLTVELIQAVVNADFAKFSLIDSAKFVEHNPMVPPGIEGLKSFSSSLKEQGAKTRVLRVFEDGDYTFAHFELEIGDRKMAGFDILRFEGGKVVEHWDNLQPMEAPNPSGRTLTDGPTDATDLHKTEANKAVAKAFVTEVLKDGQLDRFAHYAAGESYRQHNPRFGDGVQAVLTGFQNAAKAGVVFKLDKIHKVLGKGSFVMLMGEGSLNGKPIAIYDMFRVENGKLAEHWDVIADIPAPGERKNTNGKF